MKTQIVLAVLMGMALVAGAGVEKKPARPSGGSRWGVHRGGAGSEKLPRVLLVGDSIVNAYRGPVRNALKDTATVDDWVTGMHLNSGNLHKELKRVLAQGPYDVIHFNIGLHGWPEGRIPKGQYERLLKTYVEVYRKEAPGAQLIWCSTTQITMKGAPTKLDPVNNPTIVERNAIAERVMKAYGIETNDLHKLMGDKLKLMRGDKFHWAREGVEIQARRVAEVVSRALETSGGD